MPKVTIAIPTYNREEYLKNSIESVLAQTFQDFEIIIFDNKSNYDVEKLSSSFGDDRIKLIINKENIGSSNNFKNIFNYNYDSEYLIIFHDDDVMHPVMLEREVAVLDGNSDAIFVGTDLKFISDYKKMFDFCPVFGVCNSVILDKKYQLVRLFLDDFDLCFSSVMYRTKYLRNFIFNMGQFLKWWDRPFLIKLADYGKVIVIKEKLINYRVHDNQDSQAKEIGQQRHYFNLYNFFKANLPCPLSNEDKKLYYSWSTNNLILSMLMFSDDFKSYVKLLEEARRDGLFKIKFLNIRGLYYIMKVFKILLTRTIDKKWPHKSLL